MNDSVVIPVLWASAAPDILHRGYADQYYFEKIVDRTLWTPPQGLSLHSLETQGDHCELTGGVVVIAGRHNAAPHQVEWVQRQLDLMEWSVLIIASDEECDFPWQQVPESDTRKVWVMQPRPEHAGLSGLIQCGWYPGTQEGVSAGRTETSEKPLDWFFAGQITHIRRQQCASVLRRMPGGKLYETAGYFQEAVPQKEYFRLMAEAKVVPSPSGPMSVDTARPFEALEAGCIPVCDLRKPSDPQFDYWQMVFGDAPFPRIENWNDFPIYLWDALENWPSISNQCFAWWQQYKRGTAHKLDLHIRMVSGLCENSVDANDLITVIVTTSPAMIHPSTTHIQEVIDSVRQRLPRAEIIITADGVRPEQEHLRHDYEEYLRRLIWLCNFHYKNIIPIVSQEWIHQANTTRAALHLVTTPQILFMEHDTQLIGEIPWNDMCWAIRTGVANAIRLHPEASILPDHESMMVDHETREIGTDFGVLPMRRSGQWWNRPHLASTHFYRTRVMPYFSNESRTFIEDLLHGIVQTATFYDNCWDQWRLWVLCPQGDIKRSGHLDSRGSEPKYEMHW